MCGIFAVVNDQSNAAGQHVMEGLKRLEYRGYDSWGIAVQKNNKIETLKQVGKISSLNNLNGLANGQTAIAHTRWATTGRVNQVNAHPHYSTDRSFVLAQNGIVENYEELKNELVKKGYRFVSETDTEVIVRLIEDMQKSHPNLTDAVRAAFLQLAGRNTIIILTRKTDQIIAARNGSPLVIGINDKNEVYLSSDALSFSRWAKKMIVVDNGQLVNVIKNKIELMDIKTGKSVKLNIEETGINNNKVDKHNYDHYMLKEIHDTPAALDKLTKQSVRTYVHLSDAITKAKNVYVIGSGTAGVAASQIAFYLRENAKINALSLIGADAREYYDLFSPDDLIITPSQSGETADVLEVLEYAKSKGIRIASFVNMPGSMITRMSDYKFMAEAGPEICVMSTKVFTSQIAWGYLLSKIVANQYLDGVKNLKRLIDTLEIYLNNESVKKQIRNLALELKKTDDIFLLGKYQNLNIVKEGMIKLIEGTYKHAHAIPAGDLKHYAITLMEKGVPVIAILSKDKVRTDVISAINEVRARGATIIGLSEQKEKYFDYFIQVPEVGEAQAIMNIIPLQLLAYYLALEIGNDIDKPRNIAKSVTVK